MPTAHGLDYAYCCGTMDTSNVTPVKQLDGRMEVRHARDSWSMIGSAGAVLSADILGCCQLAEVAGTACSSTCGSRTG